MKRYEPSPWRALLRQGVSLKTVLVAFVPIVVWIAFIVLFASAYRAVVHVSGGVGEALWLLRILIELVTVVIAMKYFFALLQRGAADELSIPPQERS